MQPKGNTKKRAKRRIRKVIRKVEEEAQQEADERETEDHATAKSSQDKTEIPPKKEVLWDYYEAKALQEARRQAEITAELADAKVQSQAEKHEPAEPPTITKVSPSPAGASAGTSSTGTEFVALLTPKDKTEANKATTGDRKRSNSPSRR